ncbi:TetR/AcrR family transcriptional regulator [Agromyces aerolatus]|uniref:TetR/AcrR family transcriptional regulator n=1 Tax=Agromyces sp. LY-1074 TaxID=3074080 RepID=UPI0028619974|nr:MULTISPECIES: WHG domain-containing protein [unclassified Agromyces]MDR5701257.1 WHG domain-containing protein [Agromyces sp. LY-1074]MDR5706867.1 WHG domain-containing protein [Agromyces sp. LY-1358]
MPRAGLTRQAVVAAALDLVDAGGPTGFERLTLAAVAERVGVAVPSLYKHVGGLDDLRRGVALEAVLALRGVITEEAVGRAGAEALRAVARGIRSFATEHPGRYAAVQVTPALGADDRLTEAAASTVEAIAAVLRGFELPDARTVDAVRLVRSAVHGFVTLEQGGGFGLPDDLDRSFDVLVDATVAGVERLAA